MGQSFLMRTPTLLQVLQIRSIKPSFCLFHTFSPTTHRFLVQQLLNLLQNGHPLSIGLGSSLPVLLLGVQVLPSFDDRHFKVSRGPSVFERDELDPINNGGLRIEEISQPIVVLLVPCDL